MVFSKAYFVSYVTNISPVTKILGPSLQPYTALYELLRKQHGAAERINMNISTVKRVFIIAFSGTFLTLAACDHAPEKWKMPNMTALTPRLQPIFEKTKTVCFGRFTIDVPASTIVAWGDTIVPLGITVYPSGADDVKNKAHKFAAELENKKAIYHNRAPLLIADEDVTEPPGRIITGYENFEAINALKINGYFQLNNDGIIINSHPLKSARDETTSLINSIAKRLRQRTEQEIPLEPGNCIEHAFLIDDTQRRGELLNIFASASV